MISSDVDRPYIERWAQQLGMGEIWEAIEKRRGIVKFEIRSVKNGAVLRIEQDYPDAEVEEVVYQEMETDEIEAFADFLRFLDEHYGPTTNRYSPKRIHILVEPGDKYESSPEIDNP